MKNIHQLSIAGALFAPFGARSVNFHQLTAVKMIGIWILNNVVDTRAAVTASRDTIPKISQGSTSKLASIAKWLAELAETQAEPVVMSMWMAEYSVLALSSAVVSLKRFGIRAWACKLIPCQMTSAAFARTQLASR